MIGAVPIISYVFPEITYICLLSVVALFDF